MSRRRSSASTFGDGGDTLSHALACALTLVDLGLVQHRSPRPRMQAAGSDATESMQRLLRHKLGIDDAVARRAAERFGPRVMTMSRMRQTLRMLCRALFSMQAGSPALRQTPHAIRIARVIDPDALAPLDARATVPDGTAFRWRRMHHADDPALARIWQQDTVDTHIHLGGAVPPAFYWLPLVTASTNLDLIRALPNEDAGHAPWPLWARRLTTAAWLRYRLVALIGQCGSPRPGHDVLPAPDDAIWTRFRGGLPLSITERRRAVDGLVQYARRRSAARDVSIWDPLAGMAENADGDDGSLAGEAHLLHAAAGILWRAPRDRADRPAHVTALAGALLRYLRIRNAFYLALVHDVGSYGLSRFGETFKRHGVLNPWTRGPWTGRRRRRLRRQQLVMERYRFKAAVQSQLGEAFDDGPDAAHAPERAVEMRVSLWPGPSSVHRIHAWLRGLHEALDAGRRGDDLSLVPRYKVGLVVNLIRDDPAMPDAWRTLRHVLRGYPGLRPFFVGVDVAGRERYAPPRALGSTFERLRSFRDEYRARIDEPRVRLGFTFHAGEDSWDLLTGLRHVDEAVALLLRGRGRLGHGLALGVKVGDYYDDHESPEPTFGTHALDLVWAWGVARAARLPMAEAIREQLEASVGRILAGRRLRGVRHCWAKMALPGYARSGPTWDESGPERIASEAELLEELGLPPEVWPRTVTITADPFWIELVETMQQVVRARVARQEVAIEANPTSNLLIGTYHDYADLPYFAIVDAGMRVSLNTDDPGVFVTSLPGEFQRMKDALVLRGQRPADATAWLSARAHDARVTTFLTADTPSGQDAWARTHPATRRRLFTYRRPTD